VIDFVRPGLFEPGAVMAIVLWGYSFNSKFDTVFERVKGRLDPQILT
jgi:hypothetical protein